MKSGSRRCSVSCEAFVLGPDGGTTMGMQPGEDRSRGLQRRRSNEYVNRKTFRNVLDVQVIIAGWHKECEGRMPQDTPQES